MAPPPGRFEFSFDSPARAIGRFIEALGFDRYSLNVFDYGADRIAQNFDSARLTGAGARGSS